MIRAIAFDLMDTVLHDPFREALEAATQRPIEELFALREREIHRAFERGELDEDAYWAHHTDVGIVTDRDEFHRVRRAGLSWLPGMQELLDDLGGRVVRATASNYPVWVDEVATDHLEGRFEHIVASCHLGARKPDVDFYRRLLERIGFAAHEVLFVDDREKNVVAAEAVGMPSHRFEDAPTLRAWIDGFELGPAR